MQEHLLRELPDDEALLAASEIDVVRAFIDNRHAYLDAGRADRDPEWPLGLRTSPCLSEEGHARFDFSSTWGTLAANLFNSGSATALVEFDDDEDLGAFNRDGARVGVTAAGAYRVQVIVQRDVETRLVVTLTAPQDHFQVGTFVNERGPVVATVVERDLVAGVNTRIWEITGGTLQFDSIEQVDGAVVSGYIDGTLYLRP